MATSPGRTGLFETTRQLLPLVLADDLTDGLVVIDRESRIQYANPAMTRIFAFARDELEGEPLTMLIPEAYRERHREVVERYLTTGVRSRPWSEVELPGRHRDGHRLDLRVSFTEFSRNGRRLFAGTIRDRTAADDPEEEQRLLVRSYRALFEDNVAAVFRTAPDGRILAANRALARMMGLTDASELEGRNVTACYEESHEREQFVRDLRKHREVHNRELQLRRADGSVQWSLVNAVWIDDSADAEPEALVGTVVDISARKRVERELRLSEERYRRLFEQNLVGVFRSRRGPGGEVVECNQAFADIFGYDSPEEVTGRPAQDFYPEGEDRQATIETFRENRVDVRDEARLQRKDGSTVWVLAHARLLEDPEHGRILEGTIFDVSDRVRAREALERAKEKFQSVFDISPVALKIVRPETGEYVKVNEAFEEVFGYDRAQLLDGPVTSEDLWEDPSERDRIYRRLGRGEDVRKAGVRLQKRDGSVFDALFSASELQVDGERLLVAAIQDISQMKELERELEQERTQLEEVFHEAPAFLAVLRGEDYVFERANPTYRELVGDRELIDRPIREVFPELEGQPFFDLLDEVYRTGEPYHADATPVDLDAGEGRERRYLSFVYQPLTEQGDVSGILVHGFDVTDRTKAEKALRRSETRHRTLVETMAEATVILDTEGQITFANEEAKEVLGLERAGSHGQSYVHSDLKITVPDGGPFPDEKSPLRQVLKTQRPVRNVEYGVEFPDGRRRILSSNAAPLFGEDDELEGVVATIRDVTERHRMEEELRHRSLHDALTGLPNRTLFWDRLEHALERSCRTGERVAVLFLDLDGFKRINDEHGHASGDDVLRQVAGRLRSAIREADTLARVGGDEFGVLLEDLSDASEAEEAARRLTDRFDAPVPVAGEEAIIRMSCGIALAGGEEDGEEKVTADELVHLADRAMYAAKEEPGSSFRRYGPEIAEERTGRLRREIELKEALERGHVVPYYQPIVDLEDGRIVGAEALARWNHPERGLVAPGAFIPLAEETGLIVDLGRQVARSACGQLARWSEDGVLPPDFRLHLNLSARELDRPDLVDVLEEMFRELGLAPDQVAFEVTETVAVEGAGIVEAIRALGSPVAVDDFGTQYATLERLATLELDSLKLDRLFVDRIGTSSRHEAVLEASLTLAEAMGLCPVAEGVETEPQRAWLLDHGCRFAQGFLFAPAVSVDAFAAWLRSGTKLPA